MYGPISLTADTSSGLCSLVWAGFPVVLEGFNAVLGHLARWFYPFGSGAHCTNCYHYHYHYYYHYYEQQHPD